MKEVKVTVDILKNGDVTIDVDGVEGNKCLDLTKELEDKLGGDVNRKMKEDKTITKFRKKKRLIIGGK